MSARQRHRNAFATTRTLHGFRFDVQVLRGVAVLLVVLYHMRGVLPGGFVGVDVFFVISGFVIGRVLLAEYVDTGTIALARFFKRRAWRLLPALAAMVALVTLATTWLGPANSVFAAARTAIATMLLGANAYLYRVADGGYFGADAEFNPFLHNWSLSVEEQFYLVIPLLVLGALVTLGRRWRVGVVLALLLVTLTAASFALSLHFSYAAAVGPLDGPRFAFFSPVTRAWEFGVGLLLVLVPDRFRPRGVVRDAAAWMGIAGLATTAVWLPEATAFPGWVALVPTLATAVLVWSGGLEPHGDETRRAVLQPLRRLGDLSYSWYLWHWPILVFAFATWPHSPFAAPLAASASLLPAWLSYTYVEQQLRRGYAGPRSNLRSIALVATCVALPIAAGLYVQRWDRTEGVQASGPLAHHADVRAGCDSAVPLNRRASDACVWGEVSGAVGGQAGGEATFRILLVGDSNAGHYSEAFISAVTGLGGRLTIATMSACPFVDAVQPAGAAPQACATFVNETLDAIETRRPDLVLVGITHSYFGREGTTPFRTELLRTVQRIRDTNVDVALLEVLPKPQMALTEPANPLDCSRLAFRRDETRCANPPFAVADADAFQDVNAVIATIAADAGARFMTFSDVLCPDGVCPVTTNGELTWRDEGHLTVPATLSLSDRAMELIATTPSSDEQLAGARLHPRPARP